MEEYPLTHFHPFQTNFSPLTDTIYIEPVWPISFSGLSCIVHLNLEKSRILALSIDCSPKLITKQNQQCHHRSIAFDKLFNSQETMLQSINIWFLQKILLYHLKNYFIYYTISFYNTSNISIFIFRGQTGIRTLEGGGGNFKPKKKL